MTALIFLVLALAAFRVTRFITSDTLFDAPRDWFLNRFPVAGRTFTGKPPKRGAPKYAHTSQPYFVTSRSTYLGKLVSCNYCTGVWVSAAALATWRFGGDIGWYILIGLAVAGGQALLSALDGRL